MVHSLATIQRLTTFRARHLSWYRWCMMPGVFLLIVALAYALKHSGIGLVAGVVLTCLADTVISAYQVQYYNAETGRFYMLGYITPERRAALLSTLRLKILVLVGSVLVSLTAVLLLHLP